MRTIIDYQKLDSWIKKNKEKTYKELKVELPDFRVSLWTFVKRRRKILGLPLSPSMADDYKPIKNKNSRLMKPMMNVCMYSSLEQIYLKEIKNMDHVTLIQYMLSKINPIIKRNLVLVQIKDKEGEDFLELRQYNQ